MPSPRRATLPRTARLKKRSAFTRIFTEGNGTRAGQVIVKYHARPLDRREILAGFVVRKGTGSAVRRNRLRRLMRESYRLERIAFAEGLPERIELHLVFLWSGTPEQALRPELAHLREDIGAGLRRVAKRLGRMSDAQNEGQSGSN